MSDREKLNESMRKRVSGGDRLTVSALEWLCPEAGWEQTPGHTSLAGEGQVLRSSSKRGREPATEFPVCPLLSSHTLSL